MNNISKIAIVATALVSVVGAGFLGEHDGLAKGYEAGRGDQHEFESVKNIADVCYQLADKVEAIKTSKGEDDRGQMRNICDQLMVTAHHNIAKGDDCFTTFVIHEGTIPDEHRSICPANVRALKATFPTT